MIAQLAWLNYRLPPPSAFLDKPLAPALTPRPGSPRFLWIIFDELDSHLLFEQRPKSVSLPEFDRLRAASLDAMRVRSPANWTLLSMASLIAGRTFSEAELSRADELSVTEDKGSRPREFTKLPNVFRDARRAGFNTGVVGWHHPYGRLFNESLTECYWQPSAAASVEEEVSSPTLRVAIRRTMKKQIALFPMIERFGIMEPEKATRSLRLAKFVLMQRKAIEFATNRNLGMVLLHLPVPHPPGIYDRGEKRYSLDDSNDYLDNLALADRALGELRRAMEVSGTWDETAILVSSDHPLRTGYWKKTDAWTASVQAATCGNEYPYVPFLLKMAGQSQRLAYQAEFNSVLTRDLISQVMRGDVANPQQAAAWLDAKHLDAAGRHSTSRLLN